MSLSTSELPTVQQSMGVTINRPAVTAYGAAHGVPTGDFSIRVAGNK
jgi:hypothetical protein